MLPLLNIILPLFTPQIAIFICLNVVIKQHLNEIKMKATINYLLLSTCLIVFSLPTYSLESNGPIAGLIYQNEQGESISSPLLESDVEMQVNGLINRVTVKQVFKNETDQWINTRYLFPLPDKSAVDHLRLKVGERIIEGVIKPKEQAEKVYKKALQSGKKASLLSQQRSNIFTTQVANIAPHETITVEIEYQESILYRDGQFSLHFPMTITPRYVPEVKEIEGDDFLLYVAKQEKRESQEQSSESDINWSELGNEQSFNEWLDSVESYALAVDTVNAIADKNDPDLLMNISVNIMSPVSLTNINSPYHQINQQVLNGQEYVVSLNDAVTANQDFVLNWQVANNQQNKGVFYQEQWQDKQYGQLMLLPAISFNEEDKIETNIFAKEVLFVIDTSGSMSGNSMIQAKQALQYGIDQLNDHDLFNIIDFNDEATLFSPSFLSVNARNKQLAKGYIASLKAAGGTNMDKALALALSSQADTKQGLQQVVFITDASVSNESMLLKQIDDELTKQRLFMVGIGYAPNRYFMTRAAELGRGTYTNIAESHEVNTKISRLFNKIAAPVLQDIRITWEDETVVKHWPKSVGDLYQSEPIQVVMDIPEEQRGKQLVLTGYQLKNGKKTAWKKRLNTSKRIENTGIAQLWAREKIASISLDRNITTEQKKTFITELGMDHHMVTQYTSLVAVDKTPVRPAHIDSQNKQIKNMLPKGSAQRLPQTGFASDWLIKVGVLMLLMGFVLLVVKRRFDISSLLVLGK